MSTIINVIIALFVFGLIIAFHEFGHFIFAKKNGIYVNEFAVGMGPTLFSFQKKETKYSLKLIPMGGFCAMLGEDEDVEDEHSFSAKSVLARLSVVLAGPLFNFILAFLLAVILIAVAGFDVPEIAQFSDSSPAKEAGVEVGDIIVGYNGTRVYKFQEILLFNQLNQTGNDITLTVNRNGEEFDYTFTPEKTENGYLMGIYGGGRVKSSASGVVKNAFLEMRYQIKSVFLGLSYLIGGKLGFKNMSGPVGIVSMMSDTIDEAKGSANGDVSLAIINVLLSLLSFSIMLSANLGVMNLIPIPALDGGRTLFLLIEGIFKRKIPTEKEAFVNMVGFALLIGLMIVVMYQDILKIIY